LSVAFMAPHMLESSFRIEDAGPLQAVTLLGWAGKSTHQESSSVHSRSVEIFGSGSGVSKVGVSSPPRFLVLSRSSAASVARGAFVALPHFAKVFAEIQRPPREG
jgi:hypothetical protein